MFCTVELEAAPPISIILNDDPRLIAAIDGVGQVFSVDADNSSGAIGGQPLRIQLLIWCREHNRVVQGEKRARAEHCRVASADQHRVDTLFGP
jgi:hypothetical protein